LSHKKQKLVVDEAADAVNRLPKRLRLTSASSSSSSSSSAAAPPSSSSSSDALPPMSLIDLKLEYIKVNVLKYIKVNVLKDTKTDELEAKCLGRFIRVPTMHEGTAC
jgi:hypothetical protein